MSEAMTFNDFIKAAPFASNPQFLLSTTNDGNIEKVRMSQLNLDCLFDNVFIMHHRKTDDVPCLARLSKWPALQASGEIADGVAIVQGGRYLVVAPTEADSLLWSSAGTTGGATTTGDRITASVDWNGKANTASIIAASSPSAITNTSDYAPGFCNLYSRTNAGGVGIKAGKWWLPSGAEMLMIYSNMAKINHALSLIDGAIPLQENWYWTSTESGELRAWYLSLSNGALYQWLDKANYRGHVRPVASVYQD